MLFSKVQTDDVSTVFLEEARKVTLSAIAARVLRLVDDDRWLRRQRTGCLRPEKWEGGAQLDVRAKYRMIVLQCLIVEHLQNLLCLDVIRAVT